MDEAEKSRALGWQVEARQLADGRIALTTAGVPAGATITAIARRPLGQHELANLNFAPAGADAWTASQALAQGRWTLHLTVTAGGQTWTGESKLP
ncbi:MAG: hypothetical protein CVT75_04630 [Alphaproteobacteria bacterium HGW-Alphaproteobacteria-14]|nr:MAG: hypothetical protein CVT75_04630 [Alphaproteobacteria bacterium HGW-Alphaproteobacteria-14]